MFKTPREHKEELIASFTLLFAAFFILLLLGSVVFYVFEDWTYLQALHFATISLTSRGFSDVTPQHWFSIIFSVFYLIIGVAILIASLSNLIAFYTAYYQSDVGKRINKIKNDWLNKKKKPTQWITLNLKNK